MGNDCRNGHGWILWRFQILQGNPPLGSKYMLGANPSYVNIYRPSQSHVFYNTKDFSIQLYAFQRQSILKASMPVGGATMLFVSHFLSMAKYLSKYSPSSTRSRSRWSSSNSEIPSLILWYAFLKHKSQMLRRKTFKKAETLISTNKL